MPKTFLATIYLEPDPRPEHPNCWWGQCVEIADGIGGGVDLGHALADTVQETSKMLKACLESGRDLEVRRLSAEDEARWEALLADKKQPCLMLRIPLPWPEVEVQKPKEFNLIQWYQEQTESQVRPASYGYSVEISTDFLQLPPALRFDALDPSIDTSTWIWDSSVGSVSPAPKNILEAVGLEAVDAAWVSDTQQQLFKLQSKDLPERAKKNSDPGCPLDALIRKMDEDSQKF